MDMIHSTFRWRWPLLLLVQTVHLPCLLAQQRVGVESESAAGVNRVISGGDTTGIEGRRSDVRESRRRRTVGVVGMMVLVGVTFIMLLLIGLTMAWGRGLRKQVRTPVPPSPPLDELWYLRKQASRSDDVPGEELTDNGP